MKKIAIVTNYNIGEKVAAAQTVIAKLSAFDCEILIPVYGCERIGKAFRQKYALSFVPMEDVYALSDIIVVLGGDGTILEAARRSALRETPILGINLGRLGYMAELEISEIEQLSKLFDGSYQIEKRSMLSVELVKPSGETRFCAYALNDAVISNGSISRIVDLELYDGEQKVGSYRSDGIIVATPTGSTAYSMSAGGPVISPEVQCFCVTPICPHSLTARPIIFPDTALVRIKNVCQREKVLYLTLDGRNNYELYRDDSVIVSKSKLQTGLIRLKGCEFYTKLRQKMTDKI